MMSAVTALPDRIAPSKPASRVFQAAHGIVSMGGVPSAGGNAALPSLAEIGIGVSEAHDDATTLGLMDYFQRAG